jgi:uncharacterized protein (DUF952 family)
MPRRRRANVPEKLMLVFKILRIDEWRIAQGAGAYSGSDDDRRDGFIHLSTSSQLAHTLARHFSNASDLMLVALDSDALGRALKWEPGRDGENFPHLYSDLDVSRVLWTSTIPLKSPGVFVLPVQAFTEQRQPPNGVN